ncbi:MAG: ABC-F family ATP-binding cassette domain-containing protein [Anaplasmataceae bacterium]|nr:ABC-F family ATP-binding cassette domain-containing protein [Anaplasmataceae bacterium]
MSLLIQCKKISKFFGSRTLFRDVSLSVFTKDRLGLIGINGSGKSTLLKIMAGLEGADEGEVVRQRGLIVGYVPQDSPLLHAPILNILLADLANDPRQDYEKELAAEVLLGKMGFTDYQILDSALSGGWRKKLAIARQLLHDPELLFLDEPTNHLDLESILWLEKFLQQSNLTFIVVSHDRSFLDKVVTTTAELGPQFPQGILQIDAPYRRFVELKEDFLAGQKEREGSLRSKARRELEWLRSNPKARTTKSVARIQEAGELLDELQTIKERNQQRRVDIHFSASERETRKLVSTHHLSYSYGAKILFEKLDVVLSPGTRLGLLGANGSGKTTLLKLLAGELKPSQGSIKYADDLKIVYFDQERFSLPANSTIRTALATHGDYVRYRDREIHVNGWAERFLFSPTLLDMPIDKLSGGERARLLIAKLMLQPADLLLLDEPTNDLDIPTLEILEESLLDFPGALALITHDRTMLHRIANQLLEIGQETKPQHFSSFSQWEEHTLKKEEPTPPPPPPPKQNPSSAPVKRSWKETKELEEIERKIPVLEQELKDLQQKLDTALPTELHCLCTDIDDKQQHIEKLYTRWQELYPPQS